MMTYLATFIPNFSEESQTPRDLLKKNVPFEMLEDHLHSFQKLKTAIQQSCVGYFDPKKPNTLEVDSSTKALHKATTQTLTGRCSLSSWHHSLPHIPVRTPHSNDNRSQATRNDGQEAPPKGTTQAAEDAAEKRKIQGYDFTIEYRQGKTMTLAVKTTESK